MAARIGAAHFVICRSGASTVSEVSVIGRPALFVPYPFALDHDQAANAALLVEKGGAKVVPQSKLSAEKLADILKKAMEEPQTLLATAHAAKEAGIPNAANLLADLVEAIAAGKAVSQFKGQQI
jgi:UDP-N-acetylglucosamine--N-acetylmuramyl-(pentapeptide) pyrophosphoryl-undecaprenol N-acetylglucosamine transferase